jgi:hypothetical protein
LLDPTCEAELVPRDLLPQPAVMGAAEWRRCSGW